MTRDTREELAAFGGVGTGLLAAGFTGYLLYSALGRTLGWRWLFVVLFLGGGAGLISAVAGTLLRAREEVIVLSSVGTGLLTVGGLAWTLIFGGWAERLRPAVMPAAGSAGNLKQTMTWYGPDAMYRPVVLGSSLFLTVLLVAWFGAYAVFWLAGSRQPLSDILIRAPAPAEVDWEVNRFGGHRTTVHAIAFDNSGERLATGDGHGTVKLWDLNTNAERHTFTDGHNSTINALVFSPDGILLAAAADCRDVRIWNTETGEAVCRSVDHPGAVKCVAFSPDGSKIATGSTDDAVRLLDASTGQLLKSFFGCKADIESVAFLPDGDRLMALGRHDQMIRIWDIGTGRNLKPLSAPEHAWLSSFIVSPDGRRTAARTFDGTVYQWDDAGRRLGELSVGASHTGRLMAYSPDARRLLAADWPSVQLYDAVSCRVLCTFKGHSGSVTALAFHPDGDSIVSAASDNTVRLWEVPANLRHSRASAARHAGHPIPADSYDMPLDAIEADEGIVIVPVDESSFFDSEK
jgi:WD40 repeat protein